MVKKKTYTPDRGDVVWVNLNPSQGHEQKNVRPALVLSPRAYNRKTSLMVAVPLTSQQKGYPFEVLYKGKVVSGVVLSDQIRTMDWQARKVRFVERASRKTVDEVRNLVTALIG